MTYEELLTAPGPSQGRARGHPRDHFPYQAFSHSLCTLVPRPGPRVPSSFPLVEVVSRPGSQIESHCDQILRSLLCSCPSPTGRIAQPCLSRIRLLVITGWRDMSASLGGSPKKVVSRRLPTHHPGQMYEVHLLRSHQYAK